MNKNLRERMNSGFEEISTIIGLVNKEIAVIYKEIAATNKEISITDKIFEGKSISSIKRLEYSTVNLISSINELAEKEINLENWSSSYSLSFKFM